AERLLYRMPKEHLNLEIKTDHENYVPGDRVKVTVKSSGENQQPAPAIVMLAVVDKSVLKLADEKTYRSMPAHVLLTSEVRRPEDLEHADFLLGPQPSADKALDLLLGTQGWRRFAEQDPGKFQPEQREEAQRLLVLNGQFQMQSVDYAQNAIQNVKKTFQSEWTQLQARLNQASQEQVDASNGEKEKEELKRLKDESGKVHDDYKAAAAGLNEYKDFLLTTYLPWARIVLLVVAAICVVMGLARRSVASRVWSAEASPVALAPGETLGALTQPRSPGAIPFYVAAACCALMFVVLARVPIAPGEAAKLPAIDQMAKSNLNLDQEMEARKLGEN